MCMRLTKTSWVDCFFRHHAGVCACVCVWVCVGLYIFVRAYVSLTSKGTLRVILSSLLLYLPRERVTDRVFWVQATAWKHSRICCCTVPILPCHTRRVEIKARHRPTNSPARSAVFFHTVPHVIPSFRVSSHIDMLIRFMTDIAV